MSGADKMQLILDSLKKREVFYVPISPRFATGRSAKGVGKSIVGRAKLVKKERKLHKTT